MSLININYTKVQQYLPFMQQNEHVIINCRLLYVTAMVVLLNHINLPEVTIAIDGSLYEHHPKYHQHMMDVIQKWRPQTKVFKWSLTL